MPRLYESLKEQTFPPNLFEWIIGDDGSTDSLEELVQKWEKEAPFQIVYFKQPNQGKHVAVNRGISKARGRFFIIIDSDDRLLPKALQTLYDVYCSNCDQNERAIAGVWGLCLSPGGEIIGSPFPEDEVVSTHFEQYWKHGVTGDKVGFYKTSVMEEFKFPEDLGRFVPEALIWDRIGDKYQTIFVNKPVAIREYLRGGLSSRIHIIRAQSPKSCVVYYREFVKRVYIYKVGRKHLARGLVNLIRFSLRAYGLKSITNLVFDIPIYWFICVFPMGVLLYLRDSYFLMKEASRLVLSRHFKRAR